MRNGNKYNVKLTGNTGDNPDKNRFADDFERESFEGLSKHPGWKKDLREMKGIFRRKWGIPVIPVYFRFTLYTLATAVCLVFVLIISEKWYNLKETMADKMVADEISVKEQNPYSDTIVTLMPDVQKQTETTVIEKNLEQTGMIQNGSSMKDIPVVYDARTDGDVANEEIVVDKLEETESRAKAEKKARDESVALGWYDQKDFEKVKVSDNEGAGDKVLKEDRNEAEFSTIATTGSVNRKGESQTAPLLAGLVTYPQDMMYDLTVVDYTRLRTQPSFDLNLSDFTGVEPSFENDDSKRNVTKTSSMEPASAQQIPYVDFLRNAMKKFSTKMYGSALADYEVILKQYPGDLNALFYGGLCNYHLHKNDAALDYLNKVIADKVDVFYEEAEWYKSLVLIQASRESDAKILLEKIVKNDGFYKTKAEKKLKDLK